MASFSAYCSNCGLIFKSGVSIKGKAKIIMKDNLADCPRCGNIASIPDGLYEIMDGTIKLLQGYPFSYDRISLFKNIIKACRDEKLNYNQIQEKINKEAPEIKPVVEKLPKTRNDIFNYLSLLIAIFSLFSDNYNKEPNVVINQYEIINEYNILIDNSKGNSNYSIPKPDTSLVSSKYKNTGRNELCPCGSGKKFKKCHGN